MIMQVRVFSCFFAFLAALIPLQAMSGEEKSGWSLEQLINEIGGVEVRTSRFTETKEIAILNTSLIQTGTLDFHYPDKLSKRVDPPVNTFVEITGDTLRIQSPTHPPRFISISNHPQLAALLDAMRAILAGDLITLRRYYQVILKGEKAEWQIELVPRDSTVAQRISGIDIYGTGPIINRYVVLEQNGDRTTTKLEPQGE
jgi:hypothetical protein